MTHLCEFCKQQIKQKSEPYVKKYLPRTTETLYYHFRCYLHTRF